MSRYFLILHLLLFFEIGQACAGAYPYGVDTADEISVPLMPVIGFMQHHKIGKGETLLDIAREYGLGYNEIMLSNPGTDPWLPGTGKIITVPSLWILPARHEAVVINIPELRLYRFFRKHRMVKTYPIGIGREGFETPQTVCRVVERQVHPSWTVPPHARSYYRQAIIPPGPDNPLGDYWIGLSVDRLGIHGTHFPWGVGRRVSHGCMRLYPEDIVQLFHETPVGTPVEILYEPVKIGQRGDLLFLESHPDIHNRIGDLELHAWYLIRSHGVERFVYPEAVKRCIEARKGIPTVVGSINCKGEIK